MRGTTDRRDAEMHRNRAWTAVGLLTALFLLAQPATAQSPPPAGEAPATGGPLVDLVNAVLSPQFLAALVGLIVVVVGLVTLRRTESLKRRIETRYAYDSELRKARANAYRKLWQLFEPLALYAPPSRELTYAAVA